MNEEFVFSVICITGFMFVLALIRYLTSQNKRDSKNHSINLTKPVKKRRTTKIKSPDNIYDNNESLGFFSWGIDHDGGSNDGGGGSDGGGGGGDWINGKIFSPITDSTEPV